MATQDDAVQALFDAIVKVATKGGNGGTPAAAGMVRDAAIAYRAVVGGPQPGGVLANNS